MILCQVEPCDNVATWKTSKYGALCNLHQFLTHCSCDTHDGDNGFCGVHGDPTLNNIDYVRLNWTPGQEPALKEQS